MIKSSLQIAFGGQHFTLLQEKAAYWHEHKTLLIADIHAGKASHFRANGIPLSTDHLLQDLNIISRITERLECSKIIFLGDLYHTHYNAENTLIDSWLNALDLDVELIVGNHDRHSIATSTIPNREAYILSGILLSHEPEESEFANICGHLHPSFTLKGKARQHVKMPAFYILPNQLVLPSFSSINGGKMYPNLVKKSKVIMASKQGLFEV